MAARFVLVQSVASMSLPRPILPNTRYLVTRRVAHRQFLLRPNETTNQIVLYAIAYAAMVTGVLVHALVAMSNHIHPVVSDPLGKLPLFLQHFHRLVACCMNESIGRSEAFWSSDAPSIVALETDDDVIDKIAYAIANPVAAGLVEDPAEWPGVITPVCGIRMEVSRPDVFFRKNGKMPASIELNVVPPELASCGDVHAVIARLRDALDEKLGVARTAVAESGRGFLGPDGVLSASRSDSASTPEPLHTRRPRIAARRIERRKDAIDRLRAFHSSYATALRAWRAGNRTVMFPPGTYAMRVRHGVRVDTAPG